MKIIGLTGGIGSGKSTLAKWFLEKSIPVYNSDDEAKKLIHNDPEVKQKLITVFGEETYKNGQYNSVYISSMVFGNPEMLNKLNQIVHPAIFQDFKNWVKKQKSKFVVKEAAILFESGSYKDCDLILSVVADEEIRIERVKKRNNLSEEQIRKRMSSQWTDAQRIEKSDFVIENNSDLKQLKKSFDGIFDELVKKYS